MAIGRSITSEASVTGVQAVTAESTRCVQGAGWQRAHCACSWLRAPGLRDGPQATKYSLKSSSMEHSIDNAEPLMEAPPTGLTPFLRRVRVANNSGSPSGTDSNNSQGSDSSLKRSRDESAEEEDDDCVFVEEKTREQREELRAMAVDVDDGNYDEEFDSTPPVAGTNNPAPHTPVKVKKEQQEEPAARPPPLQLAQPPPPPPPPPAPLDADQQRALNMALADQNIFLTGGAGVGKSHTLKQIIAALKQKHGERQVAVCASTGVASTGIEGQTLHSLMGCGVPNHIADFGKMWKAAEGQKAAALRELAYHRRDLDGGCGVSCSLAVDRIVNWTEIKNAMKEGVDQEGRLDEHGLPYVWTPYEREAKPFGGKLQLIVCGDFMQLPPVQKDKNKASTSNKAKKSDKKESLMNAPQAGPMGGKAVPMYGSFETNGKPAFMSVVWREAKLQMIELTKVHRQRDRLLLDALNHVRNGEKHAEAVKQLCAMTRRPVSVTEDGEEPIRLFCDNAQCDNINKGKIDALLADSANDREEQRWRHRRRETDEEVERGRDQDEVVDELEEELWHAHIRSKTLPAQSDADGYFVALNGLPAAAALAAVLDQQYDERRC